MQNYKSEIEVWISDYIGQQVEISTLDAIWYGFEPQLVLKGVQLLSQDRTEVHGYFQDARVGLNLLASITEGRFVPGAFTIEGARFGVVRHKDGHISIQGVLTDDTAELQSNDFLAQWIFQQRVIEIKNSELIWADLKGDKSPRLFHNVNLRLINANNRHVIEGSVDLPEQIGSSINIVMDVAGNILSSDNWSGRSYAETKGLLLKEILELGMNHELVIRSGELNARLWGSWAKAQLVAVRGDISLDRVVLSASNSVNRRKVIDSIKTRFYSHKNNEIWQTVLDKLVVNNDGRSWPASKIHLKSSADFTKLTAKIDYLQLGDIVSWASLGVNIDDKAASIVRKLGINGELKNINLSLIDSDVYLSGEISKLESNSYKKIPGFHGIDGQFSLSKNAVELKLASPVVVMSYPDVFLKRSHLQDLTSRVLFFKEPSHWTVAAIDTAFQFKQSKIHGSLALTAGKNVTSPLLDLAFYIEGGLLADAAAYLPAKIMKSNAVPWIDEALQSGKVPYAVIAHYGHVKEYPYRANQGVFVIDAAVKNAELLFAKQWPKITEIDGLFRLQSNEFHFYANQGKSLDVPLKNVTVAYPDFKAVERDLFISGAISGASKDKLAYLHNSPLEQMFARHLNPLSIQGDSQLDLSLHVPLISVEKTTVNGELKLFDNILSSKDWLLNITDVNGSLFFTEKALKATDVTGTMFTTPIIANIETMHADNDTQLKILGHGVFDDKAIASALDFYLDRKIWGSLGKGQAEIMGELTVPLKASADEPPLSLQLDVNLQNLAINLPAPLGKKIGDSATLNLVTQLSGQKRLLNLEYGEYNAVFEITATNSTQAIERGGIGLHEQAVLPEERGFRFSGKLPSFYWSEWEPLIFPEDEALSIFQSEGPASTLSFDVTVHDVEIFDYRFSDVSVQASQTVQNWSLHLSAEAISGEVNIPLNFTKAKLIANLDKLYLSKEMESASSVVEVIDPLTIPAMNVNVGDFHYKDMSFGKLQFATQRTDKGQKIESLVVSSSAIKMTGAGDWSNVGEDQQLSTIDLTMKASNFGEALDAWGYNDVIKSGKGTLSASVNWPGKPSEFELGKVTGSIGIDMRDASILNVDMGAAKLFSVFLPRRLLLDFRDVAQKGMYFDTIKGKYGIDSGSAFTNSLDLKGPLADIDLAGRVGLVDKNFDMVVTVNRRMVGDSLPLVGTVIHPVVGGGIFVIKKLFEKQVDDILSVQYTLEGAWGGAVITPVEKVNPNQQESTDFTFD